MKPRLYHNNNCSKSRMCKKILEDNNIDFEIREYLKDQMTRNEIKNILENLNYDLIELVRDKNFKFSKKNRQVDEITNLIFSKPNLMQRPLVFFKKYFICRPPEKVLEILNIDLGGGGSRI